MTHSLWKQLLFSRETLMGMDLVDTREELDQARDEVRDSADDVAELRLRHLDLLGRHDKLRGAHVALRRRVNRVELVAEALFVHLDRSGQLDRESFKALMTELDAADGEVDGRAKSTS